VKIRWSPAATALARRRYLRDQDGMRAIGVAVAVRPAPAGCQRVVGDRGQRQAFARGLDIIDAYTPPGARYSLLAWTPAGCTQHCPVGITNTATLASLTVRSPGRHGFTYSGLPPASGHMRTWAGPGGCQAVTGSSSGPR
jgi:hypothetical protein